MRDFVAELNKLGFDPSIKQGTDDWLQMRLGVVTASQADSFLAGSTTAKFQSYLAEKAAEICTAQAAEKISSKPIQWGIDLEPEAKAIYELKHLKFVQEIPFIYKDSNKRFGCSPDGLILEDGHGLEIKCPYTSKVHVEFIVNGTIKPEYIKQCQYNMWITGLKKWDFASYDPRMQTNKLHSVTLERDEKMMDKFDEAAERFSKELDVMLAKLDTAFGAQWGELYVDDTVNITFKPATKKVEKPKVIEIDNKPFSLDLPF
jgi:putative phage-type endonuclease